jgi:hypothetical protein
MFASWPFGLSHRVVWLAGTVTVFKIGAGAGSILFEIEPTY